MQSSAHLAEKLEQTTYELNDDNTGRMSYKPTSKSSWCEATLNLHRTEDQTVYFHIHFEFTPETRDAALMRFMNNGEGIPDGVQSVSGPWFSTTLLEGWGIVEADDASALTKLISGWTDLAVDHIAPVLSGEDVLKLLPLNPNPKE